MPIGEWLINPDKCYINIALFAGLDPIYANRLMVDKRRQMLYKYWHKLDRDRQTGNRRQKTGNSGWQIFYVRDCRFWIPSTSGDIPNCTLSDRF